MSDGERATTVRARRAWVLIATAALSVLGLVPAAYGVASKAAGTSLIPVAYLLLCGAGLYGWRRWRGTRRGRLEVREGGLFLDGAPLALRAEIRHAYVTRDRDGTLVLRLARGDVLVRAIDVVIASEQEGAKLLADLRLDAAHSRAEYEMIHGSVRRFVAIFGTSYAAWFALTLLAGTLLMSGRPFSWTRLAELYVVMASLGGALAWIYQRFTPKVRVSIGADGVHVRRGARVTFHPYASIASATTTGVDVTIQLRDGGAVTFHHQSGTRLGQLSDRERDAHHIVERIEERLAAQQREPRWDASSLARNGRDVREWLRETAAQRDSAASFRTCALPAEQLWRVVEDSSAPATERAGAALALRHDLDDDNRARLRVAADACAAPHLRVALEHVADAADDDQLAEAFEPLGDEGRTTPMRTMSK